MYSFYGFMYSDITIVLFSFKSNGLWAYVPQSQGGLCANMCHDDCAFRSLAPPSGGKWTLYYSTQQDDINILSLIAPPRG